MKKGKT